MAVVTNACTREIICCEALTFWGQSVTATLWEIIYRFPKRQHLCENCVEICDCSHHWAQNVTSAFRIWLPLRRTWTCCQSLSLLMWKEYRRTCRWSLLKWNVIIFFEVSAIKVLQGFGKVQIFPDDAPSQKDVQFIWLCMWANIFSDDRLTPDLTAVLQSKAQHHWSHLERYFLLR